ncbi:nuclear transport factor 2 family protein [Kineosporia mesophila]|uniref:Nuclear transport factor 2 family protein n=1 Tax=Kineosporia mesophila TaxID=566012 RepID=A0ABP6ZNX1_9ACTN|nr:nuclear transport factor 2 family protein [Kineosporia mesophila]MCD5354474.1 nuclear transport factor 2 family protein [Kineosporia mesophila]
MADSPEASVRNLIAAHIQAQDEGRAGDIVALYTKDAVLKLPGAEPVEGHDALLAAYGQWTPTQPQLHLGANIHVTVLSDTRATARADVLFLQRTDSGWVPQVRGRYQDEYALDEGHWKIRSRVTSFES